jgi:hypothetical protein
VEQFVASLASVSSTTTEPYRVRRKDGSTVTMEQWLRAELAAIEAREKAEAAERSKPPDSRR